MSIQLTSPDALWRLVHEEAYIWEDMAGGATNMTLRNRGMPSGFARCLNELAAGAIRPTGVTQLLSNRERLGP